MDMYVHKQTNHPPPPTLEPHELHITSSSNYNQTFKSAVKTYKQHDKLHLIGYGKFATKTVNIAEDVKSRFPKVFQKTELFHTDVEEIWAPIAGEGERLGLDTLVVTRSVPCVRVTLCRESVEGCASFQQEKKLNGEMVMLLRKEAKMLREKSKSRTTSETNAPATAAAAAAGT